MSKDNNKKLKFSELVFLAHNVQYWKENKDRDEQNEIDDPFTGDPKPKIEFNDYVDIICFLSDLFKVDELREYLAEVDFTMNSEEEERQELTDDLKNLYKNTNKDEDKDD